MSAADPFSVEILSTLNFAHKAHIPMMNLENCLLIYLLMGKNFRNVAKEK